MTSRRASPERAESNSERVARLEGAYQHLAARSDIERLRGDTNANVERLTAEILKSRAEAKADNHEMKLSVEKSRAEAKADNERLRGDMDVHVERLAAEILKARAEAKADNNELKLSIEKARAEAKADNDALRVSVEKLHSTQIKWTVGVGIALLASFAGTASAMFVFASRVAQGG